MAYEVTATRRRPQTFDKLIGQDFIVATLTSSIRQGRIAHAYLFSGPRGVGKTSAARILAKALNCEKGPTDTPCGECNACGEISRGNALDVIEIDGASNTSVNDVRAIRDEILFAPNSSRYKIYIIDEVHMLSNSAFNALLKTIEEPPPHIIFIFATTEVHKVPATIRSRCQQFNFRLLPTEQIKEQLKEVTNEWNLKAEERALFWIAKEATGSLRDAYTLLDQVASFSSEGISLEKIKEKLGIVGVEQSNKIGQLIISGDKRGILEYTADILNQGISVEQFVIDLAEYFRSLLLVKSGIRKESLLSASEDSYPPELVENLSPAQIEKAIEALLECYQRIKFSLNERFELELLMSRLAGLRSQITPSELLDEVRRIKSELRSGSTPTADSSSPSKKQASVPSPGSEARGEEGQDLLGRLVEKFKRKKLALATSLGKAYTWRITDDELLISFEEGDRYSGELVEKEKEHVARQTAEILSRPVRIVVSYRSQDNSAAAELDEKVDLIKKVFRGQIVEGEEHGH